MNDITALTQRLKVYAEEFSYPVLSPDDCRTLVEALETKEELRANWFHMAQKLGDELDAAEKRIASLESRTVTVKLPSLKQMESGERYVWSDGVHNFKSDVIEILRAAGIQVIEGEGQ
ncbi:hypothetical protein ACJ5MI_004703 [Escherichia coli]